MFYKAALPLIALSTLLQAETVNYQKPWTPKGDRLPDFSYVGYHQSEITLPAQDIPAKKSVSKTSGDQAPNIQAALDEIYKSGGGVLALKAGNYALSSGLVIRNGTTLRGAGIGKTILTVNSLKNDVIKLGNTAGKEKRAPSVKIIDGYVPAGTNMVHVADASGLSIGMHVFIERGVTQDWINAMGMTAHKKADGYPRDFTWLKPGVLIQQPRKIRSINGNAIILSVPLTDSLNAENEIMSPVQLTPYDPPTQASEIGIENLSMNVSPTCSGKALNDSTCSSPAIRISAWTTDSWVRNIDLTGFNNQIDVVQSSSRITITNVTMNRDGPTDNQNGYALDISIDGSQVLVHNCKTLGAENSRSYAVATQSLAPGPNACIGFEAQQPVESIEPHQRWAHGFLNEGSKVAAVLYRNRGSAGTGHGWTVNNAVVWNSKASSFVVQNPPLGQNYCFGCVGQRSTKPGMETNSTGVFDTFVDPPSLFEAQLKDRGFAFKL